MFVCVCVCVYHISLTTLPQCTFSLNGAQAFIARVSISWDTLPQSIANDPELLSQLSILIHWTELNVIPHETDNHYRDATDWSSTNLRLDSQWLNTMIPPTSTSVSLHFVVLVRLLRSPTQWSNAVALGRAHVYVHLQRDIEKPTTASFTISTPLPSPIYDFQTRVTISCRDDSPSGASSFAIQQTNPSK